MHTGWGEREKEHMHVWTRERKSVCRHRGERERKRVPTCGGRERESPLAPLFMCFFLPPGPVLCKLGLGRGAALPEVLTQVLGPSLDLPPFYFLRLFPSLSFSPRHSGLLSPILTTSHIYPLFFRCYSHIGHYRVLKTVPCAIQKVLISSPFYIQQCTYVNPNVPIYPFLTFPLENCKFIFYICDSVL